MKYVIYEQHRPEILERTEYKTYSIYKKEAIVLNELDVVGVKTTHPSFESALAEIRSNTEKLFQ